MIRNIFLVIAFLFLMSFKSCRYDYIEIPDFEECVVLSKSFYCIDKRLNSTSIDNISDYILLQDALDEVQKRELINYFQENREKILSEKSYEISLDNIGFFKGFLLTNPTDRINLEKFINNNLEELEKFRRRCGPYRSTRISCR